MGKSSSSDLRVRIIGEIERGQSCRAAARRFGVAPATAVRGGAGDGGATGPAQGRDGIGGAVAARSPGRQWSACCPRCHAGRLG